MNDHAIVLSIQEILGGLEWTPDTLDVIAKLLNDNGYRVGDLDDKDREVSDD